MVEKAENRRLRAILNDAFAFVRGYEATETIAQVTLEDLIAEQVARNGSSEASNKEKYNPYAIPTAEEDEANSGTTPEVEDYQTTGVFVSGTEISNPTKMDRLVALSNEIEAAVKSAKEFVPEVDDYEGDDEPT
jgi:hypothetical protein